jgi:hypothetical protein
MRHGLPIVVGFFTLRKMLRDLEEEMKSGFTRLIAGMVMGVLGGLGPQGLMSAQAQTRIQGAAPEHTLPRLNLLVEWRMGGTSDVKRRQMGVQSGQILVDSRGQVIGRTGIGATRVETTVEGASVQQLQVLNGGQARLYVGRSQPSTVWQWAWVPAAQGGHVDLGEANGATAAGGAGLGVNGGRAAGSGGGTGSAWGMAPQAVAQTVWIDFGDGLVVKPRWQGGREPVLVELGAQMRQPTGNTGGGFEQDGQVRRVDVGSTLSVPLGEWTVVARSGSQSQKEQAGVLSTRELDQTESQLLEIRITTP